MQLQLLQIMEQQEPVAHARHSDPQTSHEAAASVTRIRASQQAILEVLKDGAATDEQIYARLDRLRGEKRVRMSTSGARTRRSELVTLGKVRDSGMRVRLSSGCKATIWEIA